MIFEAIPVPAPGPALLGLGIVAGVLVAWGLIKIIHALVHALFGWGGGALGHVPFVGNVLALPFHKIEQKVTHELGVWELKLDSLMGTSWHLFASYVTYLFHSIEDGARWTFNVAAHLAHFPTRRELFHLFAKALGPLWGHIRQLFRLHIHTQHKVAHVQTTAMHAEKGARVAQAQAAAVGVRWWRLRIGRRMARTESDVARLWRYVRGLPRVGATSAFLAASAWALTKLGGSWIRCSKWKKIGPKVCRNDLSWLGDLFGIALATELVIDPEAVARAALAGEDALESVVREIAS